MKKFKSKVSDMMFGQKTSRNNQFDPANNRTSNILRTPKAKIPQVPQSARNIDRLSHTMTSAFNFKAVNKSALVMDAQLSSEHTSGRRQNVTKTQQSVVEEDSEDEEKSEDMRQVIKDLTGQITQKSKELR